MQHRQLRVRHPVTGTALLVLPSICCAMCIFAHSKYTHDADHALYIVAVLFTMCTLAAAYLQTCDVQPVTYSCCSRCQVACM